MMQKFLWFIRIYVLSLLGIFIVSGFIHLIIFLLKTGIFA
jgi:hypothetical protein